MKQKRGFTLIELMIIITIIAIIVAIALPNLMRSRLQANEAAAVGNIRMISSGQISYHGAHNTFGSFATLLSKTPPWIDGTWSDGYSRSGYIYTMPTVTTSNFEAHADPVSENITGERHFFVDSSGVIRTNTGAPADKDSTPVPE